jgi:hypothetical protein
MYAWQLDHPRHRVPRTVLVDGVVTHVSRGRAVKIVGARGMGKSVLLQDIEARLAADDGTRVVLVPGPPEDATVPGAVQDLALRLGVRDLERPRMDDLIERVLTGTGSRACGISPPPRRGIWSARSAPSAIGMPTSFARSARPSRSAAA